VLQWIRHSISKGFWDITPQVYQVAVLTFTSRDVISHMTIRMYVISYRCAVDTNALSWTVFKIKLMWLPVF